MAVEVRVAREEEYEEAGRITALAYREFVRPDDHDWQEYLDMIADIADRASRTTILVALEGARILGSATIELTDRVEEEGRPLDADEAHIRMLGVDPEARRRGVARALLDGCFDTARAAGKRRITLHTTERMRAARIMYESLGFRRRPDRIFPDGFVLLSYEKDVSPTGRGVT